MTALTREAFLAADDRRPVPIELDADLYGEGARVYCTVMTGHDRSEFERRWVGEKAADNPGGFRWDLLWRTITDEGGEPLFAEDDYAAVMGDPKKPGSGKNAGTIEAIFEAAAELNGLREKDIEELAKNSASGPASASSTDSASPDSPPTPTASAAASTPAK